MNTVEVLRRRKTDAHRIFMDSSKVFNFIEPTLNHFKKYELFGASTLLVKYPIPNETRN